MVVKPQHIQNQNQQMHQQLTPSKSSSAIITSNNTLYPSQQQIQNQKQEPHTVVVQKSNSVANIFTDRLRRGSEPAGNVKRAESMKVGPKQPKRTPSFTTRRRAHSFRKNQHGGSTGSDQFDLPPVEIQGMLERKHELQSGGKKAPVRSWKPYHTVLCGQLLCFFKDEDDFLMKKASTAPVNILNAKCEKANDYTKKKNVFRLKLPDGSEFLFLSSSTEDMIDWVNKISFHADLPPNLQLLSYDESMKVILIMLLIVVSYTYSASIFSISNEPIFVYTYLFNFCGFIIIWFSRKRFMVFVINIIFNIIYSIFNKKKIIYKDIS